MIAHSISSLKLRSHSVGYTPSPNLNFELSAFTCRITQGFHLPIYIQAGTPVFFVKKKDGSLQQCIDCWILNMVTIQIRFPLSIINELLNWLCAACIFTKLVQHRAYNLVCACDGDEWKTAFQR